MKECYFTSESIDAQARALLDAVQPVCGHREIEFTPRRSALLVIDMQRFFLDEDSHAFIPSAPAIVPKIQMLLKAFESAGLPVILTRHGGAERDAGMMAKWWKGRLPGEGPLGELLPELVQNAANAVVVEKTQYDAFHETPLEDILREKKIEQVVVTGVMAHLCCETTARSAFVRGFQPFFTVDATATYNRQFHSATLLNLAHGFAVPVLAGSIVNSVVGNIAGAIE